MMMRKLFTALLLALACSLLFVLAAQADTLTFNDIHATCTVDDSYIILKPDSLASHPEWLEAHGTTEEELLADWQARGVLMQAWTKEGDACLEITAVMDDDARQYGDIDNQTPNLRANYRSRHLKGTDEFAAEGLTFESAEWKKTGQGRFLMLKYKQTVKGEVVRRGYARKTIKNGFTINLDYQVYGRKLSTKDNAALNKVWNSWKFTMVTGNAAALLDGTTVDVHVEANLNVESQPPKESNDGKFSVKGTCTPGLQIVGVLMRMSSGDLMNVETTAAKTGKFTLNVQLPSEGVWLMTMHVFNGDDDLAELAFDTITYQKSLLIVNMDQPLPTEIEDDTFVVSGTTLPQTAIQLIVDGPTVLSKTIRTNNSGKFSVKVPTDKEGSYSFTLVFEKKKYTLRRFTSVGVRRFTETDIRNHAKAAAIKPAYRTLVSKIDGYTGRVFTYPLYVVSVEESGDGWVVFMAMTSNKKGYSNIVAVTTDEDPNLTIDSKVQMYGTLVGTYLVQNSEEGDTTYPCFELIFWDR